MTAEMALTLMVCLIFKHFICDFPISVQTPWMFLNKGTYGHPGGLVHAAIHVLGSLFVLPWGLLAGMGLFAVLIMMVFEFLVHYHMDWFKVWYGRRKNWTPQTPQFWTFLGLDQMVHYFTYITMVLWLI